MLLIRCTARSACSQLKGMKHRASGDVLQGMSQKTDRQEMHEEDTEKLTHLPRRQAFELLAYKEHLRSSGLFRETLRMLQLHFRTFAGFSKFPSFSPVQYTRGTKP